MPGTPKIQRSRYSGASSCPDLIRSILMLFIGIILYILYIIIYVELILA